MKIFSFLSRDNTESPLRVILQKFPLAGAIATWCTAWLLYLVNAEISGDEISRAILICGTAFFFSTGISLFTETIEKNNYTKYLQILPILYGVAMYYTGAGVKWDFESTISLLLHLSGFIGCIFIAPYIVPYFQNRENEIKYTNYFSLTSWGLFMSGIVGFSLFILGTIGITSVVSLFGLGALVDEDKFISNWAIISLSFVAPLYGLIHLPRTTELDTKNFQTNKFFWFLIRFVGVPFIYIYFLILYAYSIRVLMNFSDWPKGMISWMVIGFSAFGYLNYIFSKSYETGGKHVSLFRKYFPLVVLPQTVMLFYAIYLRIDQYDVTMNRYFVVIFGAWLVIVSLYLILSHKKTTSLIPASLALISFVISIGPWSVFSLPLNRQYDRLIVNLEKAHILKDGIITPLKNTTDIDADLSRDIASGIDYVCSYSDCALIRNLFPEQIKDIKNDENWNVSYTVAQAIKVQQYNNFQDSTAKYIMYNSRTSILPLQLEPGYTKIVDIRSKITWTIDTKYPYITFDPETNSVIYQRDAKNATTLTLTLPEKISEDNLVFTVSDKNLTLKLYFQNFSTKNPNYTGTDSDSIDKSYYVSGMGLVQEK